MASHLLLPRRGWPAAAVSVIVAVVVMQQVAASPSVSKRSLSALARTSQLPHSSADSHQHGHDQDGGGHGGHSPQPDKRSVAALARSGDLNRGHPGPANMGNQKRYIGTIARNGEFLVKRDSVGELLQEEALRQELLQQRAAAEALMAAEEYGDDNVVEDKRSVSSLARYGPILGPKRSVASLARYGNLPVVSDKRASSPLGRYRNLPQSGKRSVEALARNGLLAKNTRIETYKRGVSSLARDGSLPGKRREPQERPGDYGDAMSQASMEVKRSLEALARNWNLPDSVGKRSPPYMEEDDDQSWGKRNVAALLRQTKFSMNDDGSGMDDSQQGEESESESGAEKQKRYLYSLGRYQRSAWPIEDVDEYEEELSGELTAPHDQSTAALNWQDYLQEIGDAPQKRFLGRIPNMGQHRSGQEKSPSRRRRPH